MIALSDQGDLHILCLPDLLRQHIPYRLPEREHIAIRLHSRTICHSSVLPDQLQISISSLGIPEHTTVVLRLYLQQIFLQGIRKHMPVCIKQGAYLRIRFFFLTKSVIAMCLIKKPSVWR